MKRLRSVRAENPGPFTLEGTRTYLVGARHVAVVDPGPAAPAHQAALVRALEGAERITLVLTHGHGDHAGAVDGLLERLAGAEVVGAGHPRARLLEDGQAVPTDAGELVALHTPGHTRDHLCLHWPAARALFAGDMVLGRGDTTWVAEYPGCVADYLASLDRLEALDLAVIHPAHGPALEDPARTLQRYRAHRLERAWQVRSALAAVSPEPGSAVPAPRSPDVVDAVLEAVYGDTVPDGLRGAARASVVALLEYVTGASR